MTPTEAQIEAARKLLRNCGIKDPPCTFDEGYRYKEAECKEEIAATIERCAQVADTYLGRIGRQIAAEIRKLKE